MYAIDREGIVKEVLKGEGTVVNSTIIGPDWMGIPEGLNQYTFDPNKAKQLLKDANWNSSAEIQPHLHPRQQDQRCLAADRPAAIQGCRHQRRSRRSWTAPSTPSASSPARRRRRPATSTSRRWTAASSARTRTSPPSTSRRRRSCPPAATTATTRTRRSMISSSRAARRRTRRSARRSTPIWRRSSTRNARGSSSGRRRTALAVLVLLAPASAAYAKSFPWKTFAAKPDAWYRGDEAARRRERPVAPVRPRRLAQEPRHVGDALRRATAPSSAARSTTARPSARSGSSPGPSSPPGEAAYREAFAKGLDHILAAQYPNGGWPQTSPPGKGYPLHHVQRQHDGQPPGAAPRRRPRRTTSRSSTPAAARPRRGRSTPGIACILKCQIRVDGKLTVWCAQHDEMTLEPRGGADVRAGLAERRARARASCCC